MQRDMGSDDVGRGDKWALAPSRAGFMPLRHPEYASEWPVKEENL